MSAIEQLNGADSLRVLTAATVAMPNEMRSILQVQTGTFVNKETRYLFILLTALYGVKAPFIRFWRSEKVAKGLFSCSGIKIKKTRNLKSLFIPI